MPPASSEQPVRPPSNASSTCSGRRESFLAPLSEVVAEGEVHIEGEDDVEPLKKVKNPKLPTAAEVEDHNRTHIPFRSWCQWCVEGRGRGDQHRSTPGSSIPIVSLDYFFITDGGVKKRGELEQTTDAPGDAELLEARKQGLVIKCVLIRCLETKCIFAHCVPCKGADEQDYVAQLVVDDILWLGHVELIVKSDNEPALRALVARALDVLRVRALPDEQPNLERVSTEEPPAYDSQANGGIEVGVMLLRGFFRTLKLCLEATLGRKIPNSHALVPWLVRHTALLLSVQSRLPDGLTPWARARGRPLSQKILGFGKLILHKLPSKGPRGQPEGTMGAR